MVTAFFGATTMLEIIFTKNGNGRVHSSRAEQKNGLLEQGGPCPGDSERATCILEQRHHAADSLCDFVGMGDRRGSRPTVLGALSTRTLDECPEAHQGAVLSDFAGGDHGTVAKQVCEVEVSACNTLAPTANSLA